METTKYEGYPGFDQPVSSLSKFHTAGDLFTILLKDGSIIHFTSNDPESFRQWLLANGVINIKADQN